MPTQLLAFAHGLVGRVAPLLLAQDAPHATGGGGAAHPASGGGQAAGGGGGLFASPLLMILMFGMLFLFMTMSSRRQKKETETLQKSLQKGDKVITTSQMLGTVVGIDDQFVTLEISEKVRVKFLREAIARKLDAGAVTATTKPATADAKK
jgi:preprotein translocase subunit YajC